VYNVPGFYNPMMKLFTDQALTNAAYQQDSRQKRGCFRVPERRAAGQTLGEAQKQDLHDCFGNLDGFGLKQG
jgi:hypothetical protein